MPTYSSLSAGGCHLLQTYHHGNRSNVSEIRLTYPDSDQADITGRHLFFFYPSSPLLLNLLEATLLYGRGTRWPMAADSWAESFLCVGCLSLDGGLPAEGAPCGHGGSRSDGGGDRTGGSRSGGCLNTAGSLWQLWNDFSSGECLGDEGGKTASSALWDSLRDRVMATTGAEGEPMMMQSSSEPLQTTE